VGGGIPTPHPAKHAARTTVARRGIMALQPNDRTDRRGRPVVLKLETDAARPRSVQ
jgi:hypothetical protein